MAKITDLSQILARESLQAAAHEVILFDGDRIHLLKPTQAMVVELMGLEQATQGKSPAEMLELYNAVVLRVLNNNREGRRFNGGYLKKHFTLEVGMALLNDYVEFIQGVQSAPN